MRYLLVFFILSHVCAFGQNFASKEYYLLDSIDLNTYTENDKQLLDSCLELYHQFQSDTSRANALNGICEGMIHEDWKRYQFFQLEIIESLLDQYKTNDTPLVIKQSLADAYNNVGFIYDDNGKINLALTYYEKCLKIRNSLKDKDGIATAYNNIALIYDTQGDIVRSIEYYTKALQLYEEVGNLDGKSIALNNLGSINVFQNDLIKAIDFYLMSLEIKKKMNDKYGIANSIANIATAYDHLDSLDKAIELNEQGLKIREEIGDIAGVANSLNNLALIFQKKGELEQAKKYFSKCVELQKGLNLPEGIANSLCNLSSIEFQLGEKSNAKQLAYSGLEIAQKHGSPSTIAMNAEMIYIIEKSELNYEQSLSMYELFIQMSDSIKNSETQKATIRQQTKYEFEKEQLLKEQQLKEERRKLEEETQRRDNLQYSIIFLGILMFFGLVLSLGFIKVSPTAAEGLIFFAFLILFEFLLVLSDPFIESITNGEPIYKLFANAVLAGAIFPAHAFFERALKKKLIE